MTQKIHPRQQFMLFEDSQQKGLKCSSRKEPLVHLRASYCCVPISSPRWWLQRLCLPIKFDWMRKEPGRNVTIQTNGNKTSLFMLFSLGGVISSNSSPFKRGWREKLWRDLPGDDGVLGGTERSWCWHSWWLLCPDRVPQPHQQRRSSVRGLLGCKGVGRSASISHLCFSTQRLLTKLLLTMRLMRHLYFRLGPQVKRRGAWLRDLKSWRPS